MLARAAGRQHEISVRFSLGASRASVAAQLLTEVLVLAVAGAGLGLLVAAEASRVFRALAKDLPRVDEIHLDGNIVLYSLACAVAATLLCGIIPAIRATQPNLGDGVAGAIGPFAGVETECGAVHAGGDLPRGAGRDPKARARACLPAVFQELGRVAPGFDAGNVLTFHINSS